MGKLLSGRYGSKPQAESFSLSLTECAQKLNLKPSDFVSEGPPQFFEKSFGSSSHYLLFYVSSEDVKDKPIWKTGYYLLPLEAKEVLAAIERRRRGASEEENLLPLEWEEEAEAPPPIKDKAMAWGRKSQPLFFLCSCKSLKIRLYPPWAMRTKWKARLRCAGKCQPPITTLL